MGVFFNKNYHCVKQQDLTDCAAACLATVSRHYGLKLSITKIREAAGTDKQGTNVYGLIKAAEQLGFSAKGVRGNQESFFGEFPLPAIAHVVIDQSYTHYVVIHAISEKQIIVADPAKGIVKYQPEEFFEIWSGVLILLVPSAKFETGDETKGLFARFFWLLKPQYKLVISVFLASLVYTLLGILGSFYFKLIMDDLLPNSLSKTLHIISIGIIMLNLFKILLNAFRSHLLLYLSQKLDIALVLGYYSHVLKLPMSFFGMRKVGEIISRFMDASKVREAISGATLTIMIDTLMAIAGGVILFMQNSYLFFIALTMVSLYAVIVFCFNQPIRDVKQEQMENNAQLTSYLVESLNGIETLKSFNVEDKIIIETEQKFIKLLKSIFKGGWINNFGGSLSSTVTSIGGVVILWVGSYRVIQGELTVGQLLTFNALLSYFVGPVRNLINLQPMMQTALVASDRLGEIFELEPESEVREQQKISPKSLKGKIELKNLDFRYGTRELVLKNINLTIAPGEKIALVGESGSGKTTLARLLLNLYQWEKGDIIINGYHLRDLNLRDLRRKIAYVSQEIFLFSGTIYENLALGMDQPALEPMIETAKLVGAHDFINQLPLRYQTRLEENGANLSGGQRQRLAITRALLKKPDILIMDEATSNLDSMAEKAVESMINQHTAGITTIVIAHRLSTIRQCDRIYVLDRGAIVESGTHEQLMQKQGFYYQFWQEQLAEHHLPYSSVLSKEGAC